MKQVGWYDLLLCAPVTHFSQTYLTVSFEETEPIVCLELLCENAGQTTEAKRARKGYRSRRESLQGFSG